MTPYSELPDNELREAVARKLNYSVRYHGFGWDNNPNTYNLYNGDILFFSAITESSAWSHVPDFPNSLDACEPVKKWLRERGYYIDSFYPSETGKQKWCVTLVGDSTDQVAYEEDDSESRALCLAFMEVKE